MTSHLAPTFIEYRVVESVLTDSRDIAKQRKETSVEYREYSYRPKRPQNTVYQRQRRTRAQQRTWRFRITAEVIVLTAILAALFMLHEKGSAYYAQAEEPIYDVESASPEISVQPIPEFTGTGAAVSGDLADPYLETDTDAAAETKPYDFSKPVPLAEAVGNDYFDDAVFIGDSRTEGLFLNTGLSNATPLVYKGLMVDTAFTKPVIRQGNQKVSVIDALRETAFSKVYIMLGINETGWVYSQIFQEKYGNIIDAIREINPEATIYIQEIMPVSSKVSSTHSYITNTKINEYNRLLQELAEDKRVCYIDTGSAVASVDGSLPQDAATDGIHLVKSYCEKWLEYLKAHTV